MATTVRRVEYFHTSVPDQPGEAYRLLASLAEQQVDLVAFTAVPIGPVKTQLTLFPGDAALLRSAARKARLDLDGPYPALLVQGDDELGALARIHEQLFQASVNVYAASGVSDGRGGFGYLIWVKPEDFEKAAATLGV
jgi:hypothetical protein